MVRRMMLPSNSTKHYTTQTILECILIYYRIGTTAYEMFRKKGHPYPSLSTLKNHLRQVDCNPGILDDFFIFIKNQIAHLEDHHKYSIISGDEMALKVNILKVSKRGQVSGVPFVSKTFASSKTSAGSKTSASSKTSAGSKTNAGSKTSAGSTLFEK